MASYAEIVKDDDKENENTNTNTNTKIIHPVKSSNQSFLKTRMFLVHR